MAMGWIRLVCLLGAIQWLGSAASAAEERWWPVQALPKALVRTREHGDLAHQMMVQSVAGLAAKAVNRGQGDELVWIFNDNHDVEKWHTAFLKRQAGIESRGEFSPWDLVDRFVRRGVVKGYILYAPDQSSGRINEHRTDMDRSVNVATSLAGLMDGVIITTALEGQAQACGLKMLIDVRGKSQAWCFENYREKFNRRLLCTQDPRKSNLRDLAIAQQSFVLYGPDDPLELAMKWLEPLSPIAGWNGGDEYQTTQLSSRYGHLQTATDWCMNLPVLMAGSERIRPHVANQFDPRGIDWGDLRQCISFVMTDGDNVQWFQSDFFHGQGSFWDNPSRGKIPFGWSCCFAQLAQLCPVVIENTLASRTGNDRFIEWGGGYYYPDLFGQARPDREALLARHAQRTWKFMRQTGTRVVAFNVAKLGSPDALGAYAAFARETDDLSAILAFQYDPYEAGAGQTFWVKDRRGVEIPVITSRYSIWEHTNRRPRSGTPAKVAREISQHLARQGPRHGWVQVHAWSYFRLAPGKNETDENMSQENAPARGGVRGYTPALWCANRLPATIRVVSPEEMIWRIRHEHDAEATKRLLEVPEAP